MMRVSSRLRTRLIIILGHTKNFTCTLPRLLLLLIVPVSENISSVSVMIFTRDGRYGAN